MRPINEWTDDDLRALVAAGEPESSSLEYKASAALHANCRAEVSKDVSGMANAAGGLIVYGIREDNHLPVSVDEGVEDPKFDREWLESVIGSNIRPQVPGVAIKAIRLNSGRECFVVAVPQSTTLAPHQAKDGRYYRRRNFKVEPMEDAEIRDVMRRGEDAEPVLHFKLYNLREHGHGSMAVTLGISATALTAVPILYAHVSMSFDSDFFDGVDPPAPPEFLLQETQMAFRGRPIPSKTFTKNMAVPGHMPLFLGQLWAMGEIDLILRPGMEYPFYYRIACPGCVTEGAAVMVLENKEPRLAQETDVVIRWRDLPLPVSHALQLEGAADQAPNSGPSSSG